MATTNPQPAKVDHPGFKHGGKGPHRFYSKDQWRWAWATHQPWAERQARRTQALRGGPKVAYNSLPRNTSASKATGSRLRG